MWVIVVSACSCVLTAFSFFCWTGYFANATSTLQPKNIQASNQTHHGSATPLTNEIEYSISNSIILLSNGGQVAAVRPKPNCTVAIVNGQPLPGLPTCPIHAT